MTQLADHRQKLQRAESHLYALDETIKWFLAHEPYIVGAEFDSESGEYIFRLTSHEEPPECLGVIIGDILFNLRSALDVLIYGLAARYGASATELEHTEFPVYSKPERFLEMLPRKLPQIPEHAQAIVEDLQPYQRRKELRWLHDLNRIDKHRLLHVTSVITGGATFKLKHPRMFKGFRGWAGVLVDGAPVGWARPWDEPVPHPEMYVEFALACDVAFSQPPAARGLVSPTLHWLRDFARDEVFKRLEPFLL